MPLEHSHSKPKRKSTLSSTSSFSGPHIQSTQYSQSSSLSSALPSDLKTRNGHGARTHSLRGLPQPRDHKPLQRENIERETQTSSTESQRRPRHQGPELRSSSQQQTPPALKARDILKHPRLQQVTGLLPGKASLWGDKELPPDELYRLAWAMTLPETFPSKRPRGNF
ncbi:hypothetical protein HD806DRAFT_295379 [Xylariaceae sp. AK1471]|nr:hypothetical protein HD806DRAFT_295379 [Xylariaceae sp. AK1471]